MVPFAHHAPGTHPRGSSYHSIGKHKEVQANQLEDVLEEVNDLQGQHVLGRRRHKGTVSVLPLALEAHTGCQ